MKGFVSILSFIIKTISELWNIIMLVRTNRLEMKMEKHNWRSQALDLVKLFSYFGNVLSPCYLIHRL